MSQQASAAARYVPSLVSWVRQMMSTKRDRDGFSSYSNVMAHSGAPPRLRSLSCGARRAPAGPSQTGAPPGALGGGGGGRGGVRTRAFVLAVLATVLLSGVVLATHQALGLSSSLQARGSWDRDDRAEFLAALGAQGKAGGSEVAVVKASLTAGGYTYWHGHPGPSVVIVTAGEVTVLEPTASGGCDRHTYGPVRRSSTGRVITTSGTRGPSPPTSRSRTSSHRGRR